MEPTVFDKIQEVELKPTMEKCYVDYAMSVITSRAIPDVRDGLKPVQRRVLFSMLELGNTPDKPTRKCARIVGDTMGKYHPHGDSSIYGALVYMAQEWNEHYLLVDGQGNFGSMDGDGAAAMRYTEARLSKVAMEMLADLNKETVDFVPNFDETEKEPVVLPSRVPNLLINGSQGIAVGMATNIPPHNLREVSEAIFKIIDNRVNEGRKTEIDEILPIVQGPDFPTGAVILGRNGINAAYRTGRGKIRVRAVTTIEPMDNGKNKIIVTEIPYLVNKARLMEKIGELHKDKRIDGITDARDVSEGDRVKIEIELRRDVNPNVVLNQLLKHTPLEDTYGVIMLALVNGEPKVLNLLEILECYLKHQEDVVTRRTKFDLRKAEERAHIIEGLFIALDHIDEIIKIIRGSANVQEAKAHLMERFGLSEPQANAIVEMKLRALTGLERAKLEEEYAELEKKIANFRAILADENLLLGVIRDELKLVSDKYGDDRKTRIENDEDEIADEDLIADSEVVIAMTKLGYIKKMSLDSFKEQSRGGRGVKGMQVLDEDYTTALEMTLNKSNVMFFTNQGRVYKLKAYEIPESQRTSRGTPVINLLQLQPGEKVTALVTQRGLDENRYIVMATKYGTVKKTKASEYRNVRQTGLIAINLNEGDELISVKDTDGESNVLLVARSGNSIFFNEKEIRLSGRNSIGVRGIKLLPGDELVSVEVEDPGKTILFVSENGLGKRTAFDEYNRQGRGGKGAKGYKVTEKSGQRVGTVLVEPGDGILLITTGGTVIRTTVDGIPLLSKTTSGVKLMSIGKDSETKIASFTVVRGVPDEEPGEEKDPDDPEAPAEKEEETVEKT